MASQKVQDDCSDASSDFGLGVEKPHPKAKGKAEGKRASTGSRKTQTGDKDKAEKADNKGDNKGEIKGDKVLDKAKQLVDQGNKAMTALAPLSSHGLWKGSFKESDTSSRLKKATAASAQLAQTAASCTDPQLKDQMEALAGNLDKKVAYISDFERLVKDIRSAKQMIPLLTDKDRVKKLCDAFGAMEPDCVSAVLLFLGQKFSEERHLYGQVGEWRTSQLDIIIVI